jgi:hypothetical protein
MAYPQNDYPLGFNPIENQMPELLSHDAPDSAMDFWSAEGLMRNSVDRLADSNSKPKA